MSMIFLNNRAMKKVLYSMMALFCFAIVSCEKEQTADNTETSPAEPFEFVLPANIPATLTASYTDTKTDYDADGKFSWTAGDQVALMYVNNLDNPTSQGWVAYEVTSTSNDGRYATFSIVETADNQNRATAMSGYKSTGIAIYPASVARPASGTSEYVSYGKPFFTKPSSLTGSASEVMLIGSPANEENPTDLKFSTAMAVLKISVSGIPSDAASFGLYTADQDNYPIAGDYLLNIGGDKEVKLDDYTKYGSSHTGQAYLKASLSGDPTQTFYFNIPTGTYAANTISMKLLDANNNVLLEKTIKKEFTFNRNDLIEVGPYEYKNEWVSLGTAKFYDKGPSNNWDTYYHAEVPIEQNVSNKNQYRLVNPYALYKSVNGNTDEPTPGEYLTFTVNPYTDLVTFEKHATGFVLNSHPIVIQHPSVDGKWDSDKSGTTAYNKVWRKDASGTPQVVQLAPYYCFSDNSNGWSRQDYNHCIEILFPGYAPTDVDIASSSSPLDNNLTITVSGTNITTAKASCNRYVSFTGMSDSFDPSVGTTFSGFSGTGFYTRQFAIQAYDSNGTEIYHNFIEKVVYTVSDETLAGTYKFDVAYGSVHYNRSSWFDISTWGNEMVLSVSDDVFKGNLMITKFFGFGSGGSINSAIVEGPFGGNASDINGSYYSGSACYGILNGTSLTFSDANQSPFMHYDGAGTTAKSTTIGPDVYIQDSGADKFAFTVDTTDGVKLTKTTNNGLVLHFSPTDNRNGDKCILTLVGASNGANAALIATKQ